MTNLLIAAAELCRQWQSPLELSVAQNRTGLEHHIPRRRSFDDETPQVVNLHADGSHRAWERSVADGAVSFVTEHGIDKPGAHTLKFWVIDSGLVLHKLVVDTGGLKPSYLGPPESPRLP